VYSQTYRNDAGGAGGVQTLGDGTFVIVKACKKRDVEFRVWRLGFRAWSLWFGIKDSRSLGLRDLQIRGFRVYGA
jgi:hypothetical protein